MADVKCVHCLQTREGITGYAYGGPLEAEIKSKICNPCWKEWKGMSIKIINEYRLDLNDPNANKMLIEQMRAFLNMPGAEGPPK
ncbi:MAG: Fe(2+)-trafficking protein [Nitrospirae bacterium]|nr:Fe(2+)-trafficking protein [Nitrospirota bacterium]